MLTTDAAWIVDAEGQSQQVEVATLVTQGIAFPFFGTELDAVSDATDRFTAEAAAYTAQATAATAIATALTARVAILSGRG